MIGAAIGGAMNAIGGLVSSAMNNAAQERMMNKQMAWQEKMNQQQQEWQEGMWNKTNEYNSASSQMQRLMEAGVNPNNAAASIAGSSGAGMATMAAQPEIPGAPSGFNSPIDLSGIGSTVAELDMMKSQKANIDSNTELTREQFETQKWQNFINPEQWEMTKSEIGASVSKLISEKDVNEAKKEELRYTVDKMMPLLYDKTHQEIDNLKKAVEQYNAQIALLREEANTQRAQQGVLEAQQGMYEQEAKGQEYENQVKQLKAKVANEFGISVDDLEGNDKWISTSVANGTFDEAEGMLTGEMWTRVKKSGVKLLDNAAGTAANNLGRNRGRGSYGKGKNRTKIVSSPNSSNANPIR